MHAQTHCAGQTMHVCTHITHIAHSMRAICVHIHVFIHAADVSAFMEIHFRRSMYIYIYIHLYVFDYSLH
jgi:hypothetical protein